MGFGGWRVDQGQGELWTWKTCCYFRFIQIFLDLPVPYSRNTKSTLAVAHSLFLFSYTLMVFVCGHKYSGTVGECLQKQSRHQTCLRFDLDLFELQVAACWRRL